MFGSKTTRGQAHIGLLQRDPPPPPGGRGKVSAQDDVAKSLTGRQFYDPSFAYNLLL